MPQDRAAGDELEVLGDDVLADLAHHEPYRRRRARGVGGRRAAGMRAPQPRGDALGRDGRAQVETGEEQNPGARRRGRPSGQVHQDNVVLGAHRLEDRLLTARRPAADIGGKHRHGVPHGQGPDQVPGPEGRLLGREVRPAQTGQHGLTAQEVQAAGGVEVHHRHPSAGSAQRPGQVQQQHAGPQAPASAGQGQDLGHRAPQGGGSGSRRPGGRRRRHRRGRRRRRCRRAPAPGLLSLRPPDRVLNGRSRPTGPRRPIRRGPQRREGHVPAVPHLRRHRVPRCLRRPDCFLQCLHRCLHCLHPSSPVSWTTASMGAFPDPAFGVGSAPVSPTRVRTRSRQRPPTSSGLWKRVAETDLWPLATRGRPPQAPGATPTQRMSQRIGQ